MFTNDELTQFKHTLLRESKILRDEIRFFLNQTHLNSHQELLNRLNNTPENKWLELLWTKCIDELKPIISNLDRVEASLSQLDIGLYGICADCEQEISKDLLFRNPSFQRCENCHQRHINNGSANPKA